MMECPHTKKRLTPFQIIILGFAGVIFIGTFLLMLPISTQNGTVAPLAVALFTSTSAVCVTGLVVRDTAVYWSTFGQCVILLLIQIGGLGVMTIAACFTLLSGRKISLMQRSVIQKEICAPELGGIVRLTGFIVKMTFFFELLGAVMMMPVFVKDFGARGVWMSVFHSVSAFCNAGFDLMGTADAEYVSLTAYAGNPVIHGIMMLLIVIGGIGFLTWEDVCVNRHHVKHYRMQSKVILTTTVLLIFVPALFFFFVDFANLPIKERVLGALFQSVTARTAGFAVTDSAVLTGAGQAIVIALMLIGGSPGSTAGGMKTTTFAVLVANALAGFHRRENPQLFGRRVETEAVKNAATVLMLYVTLFFGGAILISVIENLPLGFCLFETASALGTVGLSLGITPQLGSVSQCILMALMFFGRVGGLTLIYATASGRQKNLFRLPQEKIIIG